MKPKDAMFPSIIESYQLQLRLVASEPSHQPLWDRSGGTRKFALRAELLDRMGRKSGTTQH